jgi:hypothetical protein
VRRARSLSACGPCVRTFYSGKILSGHAITQMVCHRLPTAAARVPSQVRISGVCGGQSGTGAGFLRILQFPLPILIPPTAPYSSSPIVRGWYYRSVSGRRTKWTQSHPTPRNEKKKRKERVLCTDAARVASGPGSGPAGVTTRHRDTATPVPTARCACYSTAYDRRRNEELHNLYSPLCEGVHWIYLPQWRGFVNREMDLPVP